MTGLADLQQCLATAAFDAAAPRPVTMRSGRRSGGSRFEHYRRKITNTLAETLSAHYPVTRRLIGPESFVSIARLYSIQHPPRSPVLIEYGGALPRFIRSLGSTPSIEYLADVAELEAAFSRAFHAADESSLSIDAFARLSPDFLEDLVVAFHPSVALVASRFPVVSIWEAYRADNEPASVTRWAPETALVVRPDDDLQVWLLPAGGHVFLKALHRGATLAEATQKALEAAPNFDLAINLELLISSRVCIGLDNFALLAA